MAAPFQYSHCQRLKTAIAERIQEITGQSERWIPDSDNYVTSRLSRGVFDPSLGPNPRRLRYGFAPAEEREYAPILVQGDVNGNMTGADCSGADSQIDTTVNRTGAYGCDLPGQEVQGGFDVFSYELKGKAFETGWACALDLLLKHAYNPYIEGLRKGIKREAIKHHGWALERDVIALAKYNTSVVDGWLTSQGAFPAPPSGAINYETVARTFSILGAEGWTGPRIVGGLSREAFEKMRENYRTQHGYNIETTPSSLETEQLPAGATAVHWNGIDWVFSEFPLRGWLRQLPNGSQELVPVRPTISRAGTGGGIVPDINPDYWNCRTTCNGQSHELYEAAFIIHPDFAKVLSFSMPSVAGKTWSGQLFNLDLRLIDGPTVTNRFGVQNTDNFKFFIRALHAYSFEPGDPELAATILYRASPYNPIAVAPTCTAPDPSGPLVGVAPAFPQQHDGTRACGDPNAPECDLASFPVVQGTQTDPCPDTEGPGEFRFADGTSITTAGNTVLRLAVERVGGYAGAATVTVNTANGTATAGSDYVAVVGLVLSWQDGEGGAKYVDVEILGAAAADETFTVALSGATGAIVATGASPLTVTIGE